MKESPQWNEAEVKVEYVWYGGTEKGEDGKQTKMKEKNRGRGGVQRVERW